MVKSNSRNIFSIGVSVKTRHAKEKKRSAIATLIMIALPPLAPRCGHHAKLLTAASAAAKVIIYKSELSISVQPKIQCLLVAILTVFIWFIIELFHFQYNTVSSKMPF